MAITPANTPQTDREWLTRVEGKLDSVIDKIQGSDGRGGLCAKIEAQEDRIKKLEDWRWWLAGALSLITLLLVGRYVVLPGSLP